MIHFNIDRAALVNKDLPNIDQSRFVYGEDDEYVDDFSYFTGKAAIADLAKKIKAGKFKRAVMLHKLLTVAKERHIRCAYINYSRNQLTTNGTVTVLGNHCMSFTLALSVRKNTIVFKTSRFDHRELCDIGSSIEHSQGQQKVLEDMASLLDEVNESLQFIGPKIDKLFK